MEAPPSNTIRFINGEPAIKTTALLRAFDINYGSTRQDLIDRLQFLIDYNAEDYLTKTEWYVADNII
jgi:hypothetical protein